MNIVSWIAVIILLLSVINGYRRGFVNSVFSALSFVVAIIVALALSPKLSAQMMNSSFYETVNSGVESVMLGSVTGNSTDSSSSDASYAGSYGSSSDASSASGSSSSDASSASGSSSSSSGSDGLFDLFNMVAADNREADQILPSDLLQSLFGSDEGSSAASSAASAVAEAAGSSVSSSDVQDVLNSSDASSYAGQAQDILDSSEGQEAVINSLPLPQYIKDALAANNSSTTYESLGVNAFTGYVSAYITRFIINVLAFILVFLLAFIALKLIQRALDLATRMPVLGAANRIGGLFFGLINGIFILWVIVSICSLLGGTGLANYINDGINNSSMLSVLYNNNFLLKFMTNLSSILGQA